MTELTDPARPEPADDHAPGDSLIDSPGDSQIDSPGDSPVDEALGEGAAAVGDIVSSLEHLDQLSIEQHAAVFETAHDQLRTLLTHAGDPAPDAAPPAS